MTRRQSITDSSKAITDLFAQTDQEIEVTTRRLWLFVSQGEGEESPAKNVDIYKSILRQNGGPLHAKDILERFRNDYGRELQGKTEPVEQIRSALQNGKTWFVNVGDNLWWLTEEALAEIGEEDHSFSGSL